MSILEASSFVVADWTDDGSRPGSAIAPLHVHHSDDEAWLVITGRLGFQVGDEQREVGAGDGLVVPAGTPHSYWNAVAEPSRYVLVMTPRIHALIQALHAGSRADFERIFSEHDSQLLA